MRLFWYRFATEKYRWLALVFLALGLAIVIIDNSVLNVAVPYIIRDLHTSFDAMQWVISGYALIIATLLITVGRLGDIIGRKKVFLVGCTFFAIGSFIASIASNVEILFLGEALVEAIGAAMMLTSTLTLLTTEFHGKERAIAFGIWGSVAGASGTIGPLLGGYLTTNYSWRWSLRINVVVAMIAILGSIFIKEAKAAEKKAFDLLGTLFSGIGLFCLVFGFIEGQTYGWWQVSTPLMVDSWQWPFPISIIPFVFLAAAIFLILFGITEYRIEHRGGSPLLKPSMFAIRTFSLSVLTLGIVALGQFGTFFILPIYLQNVIGYNAFTTGIVFLPASVTIAVVGPVSGFLASRIGPKWLVNIGMFIGALGVFLLYESLSVSATGWDLLLPLILFGVGVGASSAQLTNLVVSSVPGNLSGEASATNATVRQVGTSIGVAIIGVILSHGVASRIPYYIQTDTLLPDGIKQLLVAHTHNISVESGQKGNFPPGTPKSIISEVTIDIDYAIVDAARWSILTALGFIFTGAIVSLGIPTLRRFPRRERHTHPPTGPPLHEESKEIVIFEKK